MAAPAALSSYIDGIQARQRTPARSQVEIRRLGDAQGEVVNKGANVQIATLVFLTVLIGWCMLLIPAHTIARGWREIGDEPAWRPPGGNGNGNGNGAARHRAAVRASRLEKAR